MTWSIIARDHATGQLGIAVATKFFAVGACVPHIAARFGGIATQALVNPYYGIDGVKLLREGRTPEEIIKTLDRGRRRPRKPATAHHGCEGPHRRAHRPGMRRMVRAYRGRRLFDCRQHAGGRCRARRHRECLCRQREPALCATADRSHAGRRSGRRRQARKTIGGASDPWRGRMVRSRPARRRPRRSATRAGTARTGQPRTLGALPEIPADPRKSGRDYRSRNHRRRHRSRDCGRDDDD